MKHANNSPPYTDLVCNFEGHQAHEKMSLFAGFISRIDGNSMEPTLKNSDLVFVNVWSLRRQSLNRGDIVVFVSHLGKLTLKIAGRWCTFCTALF